MKKVYCVYEDNHGMVGLATDYQSAINGLITENGLMKILNCLMIMVFLVQ